MTLNVAAGTTAMADIVAASKPNVNLPEAYTNMTNHVQLSRNAAKI